MKESTMRKRMSGRGYRRKFTKARNKTRRVNKGAIARGGFRF